MIGYITSDTPPSGRSDLSIGSQTRVEALARLFDSKWRVPGTGIRFGADALMSLLPGVGPAMSTIVSAYSIEKHASWACRREHFSA
jgi:hypothetical protein